MARRSSSRRAAAQSSGRLAGLEYQRRGMQSRANIQQKEFADRERRIDARYGAAVQALGVMEKMSAKKAQDIKVEKAVSNLQNELGTEVEYSKGSIGGWLKGENKFGEIGQESFKYGDKEFSRADILAYDKTWQKNKWDDIDVDNTNKTPASKKATEKVAQSDPASADEGGIKAWTYGGQKEADKALAVQERAERSRKTKDDLNKAFNYDAENKRFGKHKGIDYFSDESKQARSEKRFFKEQMNAQKKKEGGWFNKLSAKFSEAFGEDKDVKNMIAEREGAKIDNTDDGSDVPLLDTKALAEEYTNMPKEEFDKVASMVGETEATAMIDADMSDANADKNLPEAPKIDKGVEEVAKKGYIGDYKGFDFMKGKSMGDYLKGVFGKKPKPDRTTVDDMMKEAIGDSEQQLHDMADEVFGPEGTIPEPETKPEVTNKEIAQSLDVVEKEAYRNRADMYSKKKWAFDDSVKANDQMRLEFSTKDDKAGVSQYSLYEGDNLLVENAIGLKLDAEGNPTRNLAGMSDMIKGWKQKEDGVMINPIGDLVENFQTFGMLDETAEEINMQKKLIASR